jgi:hypothetical protein
MFDLLKVFTDLRAGRAFSGSYINLCNFSDSGSFEKDWQRRHGRRSRAGALSVARGLALRSTQQVPRK